MISDFQAELEEIVQYLREPHKFTTLGGKLPKVRGLLAVLCAQFVNNTMQVTAEQFCSVRQ